MSGSFLMKLIKKRLINIKDYIIKNYVKLGLDEKLAILLIHIYDLQESGEHFLSINELINKTTFDFIECSDLVYKLVQKNLLAFNMIIDDNGKRKEMFTLEPLYQKIIEDIVYESEVNLQKNIDNNISDLVTFIEREFGRTLSAFEFEMISSWINEDRYEISLIKLALKEAILSSAYNLKYVDRILLNWQQKNIKTIEQAREHTKTFKRYEAPRKEKTNHEETYESWMK